MQERDPVSRRALGDAVRTQIGATGAPLAGETAWGTLEIQHMLKQLGHFAGTPSTAMTGLARSALQAFQRSEGLTDDGAPRLCTRVALIRAYQNNLVATAVPDARFETASTVVLCARRQRPGHGARVAARPRGGDFGARHPGSDGSYDPGVGVWRWSRDSHASSTHMCCASHSCTDFGGATSTGTSRCSGDVPPLFRPAKSRQIPATRGYRDMFRELFLAVPPG